MSVKITIPAEAIPDLEKIALLPDDAFEALIMTLEETKPTLTTRQFESCLIKDAKLPENFDLHAILAPVFVLFPLMHKAKAPVEKVAEAVVEFPLLVKSSKLTPELLTKLKSRLERLLRLENTLGVTAKALEVMTEHEHIFRSARIVSDIRPVFAGGGDQAAGAMIIHNIQLEFHKGEELREIYIALDSRDLNVLKDVIERAQKKSIAMEKILASAGIPHLEV